MAKNKSNKNKDGIGMFNPYKNEIQMFAMIKSSQKLQEFSQNCPRSPETTPKTVLPFKMTSPALLLKFTWHAMRPCVFSMAMPFAHVFFFGMAICLDHVFLAWPMLFAKIPKSLHCWLHLHVFCHGMTGSSSLHVPKLYAPSIQASMHPSSTFHAP